MYEFQSSKTFSWLNEELEQVLPKEIRVGSREYFRRNDSN